MPNLNICTKPRFAEQYREFRYAAQVRKSLEDNHGAFSFTVREYEERYVIMIQAKFRDCLIFVGFYRKVNKRK